MSLTLTSGRSRGRRGDPLPGFGLSLGITLAWLSLVVLVPLTALALRPWSLGIAGVAEVLSDVRVLAALRLSFTTALLAAAANLPLGLLVAWVLVRQRFPGRPVLDAMVDLPFALPTAVAGLALTALFAPNGWLGVPLKAIGVQVAYTPLGIFVAMMFVGLPFAVRTVEPVLRDLGTDSEEAAATLGASRPQTLARVVLPAIAPALLTGFALAFARAVGEYGSIIFIAGNRPLVSEIAPLVIVQRLEGFDYPGAAAIGLAMLVASFLVLLLLGLVQARLRPGGRG